jgi:hypothetical protein
VTFTGHHKLSDRAPAQAGTPQCSAAIAARQDLFPLGRGISSCALAGNCPLRVK